MGKGAQVKTKFRKLYLKLGPSGYTVTIEIPAGGSVMNPGIEPVTIDVTKWLIEAQAEDIKMLHANQLITVEYDRILDMWGGALDSSARISVIEPMLQRVMQYDGAVNFGSYRLKLEDYKFDFVVEGIIPRVFLICTGVKTTR